MKQQTQRRRDHRWRGDHRWHALGLLLMGFGCTDSAGLEAGDNTHAGGQAPVGGGTGGGSSSPGGSGMGGTGSGADDPGTPTLPPEVEVKLDFELPQASQRFVYAANPEHGTVSIIDAETLAIQTLETGDRPTFLRTLAGTDDAIVLNVGSDDATVLRSPATGAKTSNVDVVRGANAIAVAPDGKHAVVYFNSQFSTAGSSSGSFQDVTVLTLAEDGDSAVGMTVGFRPRDVFFTADGSIGYVVTDDGISVLDFAAVERDGTGIARLISLGEDIDQKSLDVSVTPDGRYALTREPGQSVIRLVDLESGERDNLDLSVFGSELEDELDAGVPLPIDVTDIDLSPHGDFALAVLRNQAAVLRIPIPQAFSDDEQVSVYQVPGEIIGSVSIAPTADRALLYTTAASLERITVLALDSDEDPRTVALRKTIHAVVIAPDGQTALIVHKKADGDPNEPGLDPDLKIDRSFGYSVLRIGSGDVKLQITATPPGAFTIVPDGSHLFLLFRADPGVREVHQIEAKSFLVTPIELGSPPVSIGTVPSSERVFVNQDHPDGRITFIDYKSGARPRTVTGFELNSRIRD